MPGLGAEAQDSEDTSEERPGVGCAETPEGVRQRYWLKLGVYIE